MYEIKHCNELKHSVYKELDWLQKNYPVLYYMLVSRNEILQHSINVVKLAVLIACELELSLRERELLSRGGLVHDIGKTYWPQIYDTKYPLDEFDYKFVKFHPEAGYSILKSIKFPEEYSLIALLHHERINGQGYPFSLTNISTSVKITSIADSYDAMTSKRAYKKKVHSPEKAVEELLDDEGYDQELVKVLEQLVKSRRAVM